MCASLSTGASTVSVGELELASLPDAVGLLGELDELYPDVAAEEWEPYRALYPTLFAGSKWRLPVTCFLVRTGSRTIVVDAGVGPPGRWDWEPESEGGLPQALEAHGLEPVDVDTVFLTHPHVDHVGWLANGGLFERARIVMHGDALAFAIANSRIEWLPGRLQELLDGGHIETIVDGAELAPGVATQAYPGHYHGHLGLRIEAGGTRAVMIADAAVHPALLDRPGWRYVSDHDHETSASTRRSLVADFAGTDTIVAGSHYPDGGIGRMVRRGDRIAWEEVR
jgi:glyoxylase-like metal-dependent hydrolase (beta-lactamase superfamily II)